MPLSRKVARFNRRVTNRVTRTFAGWAPTFGIVHHRGRSSGRAYQTPVNVFARRGGYAVALTYGPGAEWVRNVLANGEAVLETRGRRYHVTHPRLVHDPQGRHVPRPVRAVLEILNVDTFLLLDT
ncbi:MAG: nitroreductase family deazaflavin-dependent oxidoreductase [Chloroflexota bacterium]